MTQQEAIDRIREALKRRSPKKWSVTKWTGTARGWIIVRAPKSRWIPDSSCMNDLDAFELGSLFGLTTVHRQGLLIPSSTDYYQEYVDRAEGRVPTVLGKPYWD